MVLGMAVGYKLRKDTAGADSFLKNKQNSAIAQVVSIIDKMYVDNKNVDSLQAKAINDLLAQLDPHSVYISAEQLQVLNDETKGSYRGMGIGFELIKDSVVITNVTKDGPAFKVGIQVGDRFLAFNDSIKISGPQRSQEGVVNLLSRLGNTIKVELVRNNKISNVNIEKALLPVSSIDAAYMLDSITAYVKLNKFSETTYHDFMMALEKLKAAGMKQLVLDIRGNSGGLLSSATEIANEFLLQDQLIVYTEGAKVGRIDYRCKRDGFYPTLKLAVLVDETTASASEIVAGSLQDWDRATIIGRRTFGKGLVQDQFRLTNGDALRLTVARYFTPLGRNIQKPYNEGIENYKNELAARFHNGETVLGDTSSPKGKAFKTPKGHTVYGGGGITPDVFVPFDSTLLPKQAVDLFLKGVLTKFTFLYYMQHKAVLEKMKTPVELVKAIQPVEEVWQPLCAFAKNDGVDITTLNAEAKANILEKFEAFLAKAVYGSQGYFEINNQDDSIVQKGLEVINEKK